MKFDIWKECEIEADKSNCQRVHFGSIIIKDGIIIGRGHNKSLEPESCCLKNKGYKLGSNPGLCYAVHSEWMALFDAFKNAPDKVRGSLLYILGKYPDGRIRKHNWFSCTVCIRLLRLAGLKGIFRIGSDGKPLYLHLKKAFRSAYHELITKGGAERIR